MTACIRRGDRIKDKTLGIRRDLLIQICDELLKKGDTLCYRDRAVMLCLYHAIGRGGEVSTLNFQMMNWDENDDILWTGWHEAKTSQENEISYHPDRLSYKVDVIHALACYIVTQGGRLNSGDPETKDWLFPEFYNLASGGASSKATRVLKSLVDKIPNLLAEHASHGLRAGPSDDLAMNELVDVISMICRGNWYVIYS